MGVIRGTLLGIEHMRKDQGGRGGQIINISSSAGKNTENETTELSNCLQVEECCLCHWAPSNKYKIFINCIKAGETDLAQWVVFGLHMHMIVSTCCGILLCRVTFTS